MNNKIEFENVQLEIRYGTGRGPQFTVSRCARH